MKIGILTYHSPCNFGANLQAYASMKYFASLGHDTWVINYAIGPDSAADGQIEAHNHFSQNVLRVTKKVTKDDILDLVKEMGFDAIGIGADAVWNKRDVDNLRVFFGDWLFKSDLKNKVKVFAISPAFMGQTYKDLPQNLRDDFKSAIEHFTFLDTRDQWTAHIINEDIAGYELVKTINPDPVFMIDEFIDVDWIHPRFVQSKKYCLISLSNKENNRVVFLKQLWMNALRNILHRRGYQLIEIPIPNGRSGLSFDYTVPYPIDPLQWYLWIKNAKFYIGLRFHAVVSCLSSGTPFLSLDSYGKIDTKFHKIISYLGFHGKDHAINKSSKIRNLLDGSGLEQCRINGTFIYMLSPMRVLKNLERVDVEVIRKFRIKNMKLFEANMNQALKQMAD
jgi:hypothetical protein